MHDGPMRRRRADATAADRCDKDAGVPSSTGPTEPDVVVVGAGLIGLATAWRLLRRRPGLAVTVLEKEPRVAAHQSGHNSGVVHSGVYYPPGSLKARLCRAGQAELAEFAERHGIAFERCGKVIVATRPAELGRLAELARRGEANGVRGLALLDRAGLAEIEPACTGVAALHVPGTAIVDFPAVARALAAEVVALGGQVLVGRSVARLVEGSRATVVEVAGGEAFSARLVVTCAGLQSDRFGRPGAAADDLRIVPFRGDYYLLTEEARPWCRGLIYPVPDPALPFLGVHLTRRVDGAVWAGPNATLAWAREGYRRASWEWAEVAGLLADRGFRRFARRWWRTGLAEQWRDLVKGAFLAELRRFVPALERRHLAPGPSGVRAQAIRGDGSMVDDFAIVTRSHLLAVRNAPSPGATASLAIGAHLAGLAAAVLDGSGGR